MAGKKGKAKSEALTSAPNASTKMGRAEQGSGIPKPCAEPASSQNNGTKGSAAMPVGTMKNGLSIAKQSIAASKVRRMSSLGARCMSYLLARRRFALVVGLFAGLAIPWAGHNLGIWDTELPLQVLDEYVKKSRSAFDQARREIQDFSPTDLKLFYQLREIMDFTPKVSPKNASFERPGVNLWTDGVRSKHPVVMLPGIVTTGLELWSGEDCAKGYFRQRMWGTMTMVQNMMLNTKCWLRHMALDPVTGLDPPNIKLRSAQGFEAADFVVGGYWVWSKLIENLADIGYDPSSMYMASYDWRLAYPLLEDRDQFFTRLSSQVEVMVEGNGAKAILIAHSMGGNVLFYFLHWATANRRSDWVDKHIHSVVGLAIPWLGVPKGISAVLSGEAKDTAEMGVLGGILDHHLPRKERTRLFRSWGSTPSMFPKGGDVFWGGRNRKFPAPDVLEDEEKAFKCASMLHMEEEELSVEEAIDYVLESSSKAPVQDGQLANYHKWYSHGLRTAPFEHNGKRKKRTRSPDKSEQCASHEMMNETKFWTNPLEMPLPFAPNLTIYCMYGVGKETERAYFYKRTNKNISRNQTEEGQEADDTEWRIDTSLEDSMTSLGIIRGQGDGSVPLLSLGFMCQRGWKTRHWNPAGSKTVIREYLHEPASTFIDLRGGDTSADHVDIMGNRNMINDVLMIASGENLEDKIQSNIANISNNINLPNLT